MGIKKLFRDVVGTGAELLNKEDPFEEKRPPEILVERKNGRGHVVSQLVRANSGSESTRHMAGITIQGDRTIVSTHLTNVRRGLFDVHIEDWDTQVPGRGMTRSEDFDPDWWKYRGQ